MNPTGIICGLAVVFSLSGGGTADENDATGIAEMMGHNMTGTQPLDADVDPSEVKYVLYKRPTLDEYVEIILNNASSLKSSGFNSSIKTIFICHGWSADGFKGQAVQLIKNAALEACFFNILMVNFNNYTSGSYPEAVKHTRPVGEHICKFIVFLHREGGMDLSKLHLVGYSLGAHVAGVAARCVKRLLSTPVGVLSALDPAGPLFYVNENKLVKTDAAYVAVIHSCAFIVGTAEHLGHANFCPNGGVCPQPGCLGLDAIGCSHDISTKFFAESFNCSRLFETKKCEGYVPIGCKSGGPLMGYPAVHNNISGVFHLTTNSKSPYAKKETKEKCSYCDY